MAANKSWVARIWGELESTIFGAILTKLGEWALPIVVALVPAVTGYTLDPGLPWTYIVTCMALTFAGTMTGLLAFRAWRYSQSPEHKLKILGHRIIWNGNKNTAGNVTGLEMARVEINFQNSMVFPISIVVDEFDCSFEGRIPRNRSNRGLAWTIQAQGNGFFRDDRIDMTGLPTQNLQGTLRYRIRYGKPGREKFVIEDRLVLFAVYNPEAITYTLQTTIETPGAALGA